MLVGVVIGLVAALAATVALGHVRMTRRVAREALEMWQLAGDPAAAAPAGTAGLEGLPAPVRRYLEIALRGRREPVRSTRLLHGGTFRPVLGQPSRGIRGRQYFCADPPGFVWWGRIDLAPGLWVEARDRSVAGEANMLILLASTVTLNDARGPELDEAALQRLVGEMVWFPTAFLDRRFVTWSALDARSAEARIAVGGHEGRVVFHFGEDGLPARATALRYRDVDGRPVLTPWTGLVRDFHEAGGLLVPREIEAVWNLETGDFSYGCFRVERLEHDCPEPF